MHATVAASRQGARSLAQLTRFTWGVNLPRLLKSLMCSTIQNACHQAGRKCSAYISQALSSKLSKLWGGLQVVDGGEMGSRRHLNIRGKSANLPAITERDWKDIEFGVKMEVDFYALSFVRDAECIYELQEYLRKKGSTAKVCTPFGACFPVTMLWHRNNSSSRILYNNMQSLRSSAVLAMDRFCSVASAPAACTLLPVGLHPYSLHISWILLCSAVGSVHVVAEVARADHRHTHASVWQQALFAQYSRLL